MMSIKPEGAGTWVSYLNCDVDGCLTGQEFEGDTVDAVHRAMHDAGWQVHPSRCPTCRTDELVDV